MKKKISYFVLTFAIATALFSSCEKTAVQEIAVPPTGGMVRFYNFSPNAPTPNLFANGVKVTATLSTSGAESATGVAFGGVFPGNNNYSIVPAGTIEFKAQLPSTHATDANKVLATLSTSIAENKKYSVYMSGIYNTTTKTGSEAFIIEDQLPEVDTAFAYVRLINGISNANPFNLYIKNQNIPNAPDILVATGVTYKTASVFAKVPFGVYTLYIRYPNSATNVISRIDVSFLKERVYTISARGDITVTSTTATNRPFLDNTLNR